MRWGGMKEEEVVDGIFKAAETQETICNNCGSNDAKLIYDFDHGITLECSNCGNIYEVVEDEKLEMQGQKSRGNKMKNVKLKHVELRHNSILRVTTNHIYIGVRDERGRFIQGHIAIAPRDSKGKFCTIEE